MGDERFFPILPQFPVICQSKSSPPGTPNNHYLMDGSLVISNHFPSKDLVKIIQFKANHFNSWMAIRFDRTDPIGPPPPKKHQSSLRLNVWNLPELLCVQKCVPKNSRTKKKRTILAEILHL